MEYLTIEAQYDYAKASSEFVQPDRFTQAITDADQFTEKYPKSVYLSQMLQI